MRKLFPILLLLFNSSIVFGQAINSTSIQASQSFIWLKPAILSDSTIKLSVDFPVNGDTLLRAKSNTNGFVKGYINYNPAVYFGNDSSYYYIPLDSLQSLGDFSLMIAYQSNETEEYGIWSIIDTTEILYLSSRNVTMEGLDINYCSSNYLSPVVNSFYQNLGSYAQHSGIMYTDTTNIGDTNINFIDTLFFGKGNNTFFTGNIGEAILFFERLEQPDRNKWQSYLSMKYGATIKRDHYFNSNNDTLWNTIADSLFSEGIAVIGFDSATTLAQSQSQIFEDKVVLSLGNVMENNVLNINTLPDNAFILWGHDGKKSEFWGDEYMVDTITYMLSERRWKLKTHNLTTNPLTTLTYEYNTDYLPEQIVLLVDRTNEFVSSDNTINSGYYTNNDLNFYASEIHLPDTIIDGKVYFRNINWLNNANCNDVVFTFAYIFYPNDVIGSGKSSVMEGGNHSNNEEDYFLLLPNPSQGTYTLHIELNKESMIDVSVTDAAGKTVSRNTYKSNKVFDIVDTIKERGSYMINIGYGNGKKKTLKLIISY